MPLPALLLPLLFAGASAAQTIGGAVAGNKRANADRQFSAEQAKLEREQRERELALQESQLNPFRQQMSQAGSINSLDMLERSSYEPVRLSTPQGQGNNMASFRPQRTGGTSYTKSPEAIQAYNLLKQAVMSGRGAPTLSTNPAAKQTGALDLLSMMNLMAPAYQAPQANEVNTSKVKRRGPIKPVGYEDEPLYQPNYY